MKLWKHNNDPTRNEQSWFWSQSGRFLAYVLIILGTLLTFLIANLASNIVQVLLVGILDKNNGIMSGNGIQTTFNFMLNAIWNWGSLFYNNELISSIYLGGSQFFQNHGVMLASVLKWGIFLFLFWHYNVYYIMRFYNRSSKLNHGEQGDDRLATPQEIGEETFKVPDRRYGYNFPSGLLIMHKMNTRGRINQFVKQQMMPTQKALQLRKDEDTGFKIIESILFAIIVAFMALGTFFDYGKPTSTLPFYSPVRLWRGIGDVFSFVFHTIIYNLGVWIWNVENALLHAPLYVSAPVIALEVITIGYIIVHSYNHFTHANMTDRTISHVDLKGYGHYWKQRIVHWKNSLRQDRYNRDPVDTSDYDNSIESQESAQEAKNRSTDDEKNPSVDISADSPFNLVDDLDEKQVQKMSQEDKNDAETTHVDTEPISHKGTDKGIHSKKSPVIRALYKIGMHPLKSGEYMFLNGLNLLPLDRGITGYYYVNAKLMNTLIYGTTRSGKGQMEINTTIENNSRTKKQKKNMLINDSKGELSAGFYKTLKKRGYRVEVLNIIQMLHSMSYNPLELVKRHAMQGDIGQAAKACSDLSYTIYQSSQAAQGQNAFFYNSAANVFDASAFALLALANSEVYGKDDENLLITKKHDPNAFDKITIANIVQLTTQLGGSQSTEVGDDEEGGSQASSNQLIIFFKHLGEQVQALRDLRDQRKQDDPKKYEGTDINPLTNMESDQLNILDQALQKFNQSKMAGDEASGSIYSTFIEGLRIYQQPDVAKMTSMNSTNLEELGFDRLLTIQFNRAFNQQQVKAEIIAPMEHPNGKTTYKVIEEDMSHLSTIGLSQIPIRKSIDYDHFYLRLTIHDERIDSQRYNDKFQWLIDCHKTYFGYDEVKQMKNDSRQAPKVADIDLDDTDHVAFDHYTKDKVFKKIAMKIKYEPPKSHFAEDRIGLNVLNSLARSNEESLRIDQLKFLYQEKPTALFLVTPPDQQELNQLCTFLINQVFNTLYSLSSTITDERKVQRPLQMVLDEVGNIPAIPKLDTKASIGLSAGIEMMLVFQDRKQIDKIYQKEVAGIVVANCATTIYILSHDDNTIKEVSDAFGNRTIKSSQLTTNPNGLNGTSKNYNLQKQDVMPMGRLRHLNIGEMAVIRTTDRSDVWGQNVRPNPVFNTYWGHQNYLMPYAFWFLGDEIESDVSLSSIPVVTPHKYLDLNDMTINFNNLYMQMEAQNTMDSSFFHKMLTKVRDELEDKGSDPTAQNGIDDEIKSAQAKKSLGDLLDVRKKYTQKPTQDTKTQGGEAVEYFDRIALAIDKLGRDNRVVDILYQFSNQTDIDIGVLRYISESIFQHFDDQSIDYYALDKAGMDKIIKIIQYLNKFQPDDNDTQSDDLEMYMLEMMHQVNRTFDNYLVNLDILSLQDGSYQLTQQGNDFIQNASQYADEYIKKILGRSNDQGKIKDFVLLLIQIIKDFYASEYQGLNLKDDQMNELKEWTGILLFRQFDNTKASARLLSDDKGNHEHEIAMFPMIQEILGIFDNMYLSYQAHETQQTTQEEQCINNRKTSDSLELLLDELVRNDKAFKDEQ